MINKTILIGRAGKDPELFTTKSDKSVVKFSVATWENYKDESQESGWRQETEWHNVIVWGAAAITLNKKLQKGMLVYVEGSIRTRTYDDKEGNKKYITEIVGFAKVLTPKESAAATSEPTPKVAPAKDAPTSQEEPDDMPF